MVMPQANGTMVASVARVLTARRRSCVEEGSAEFDEGARSSLTSKLYKASAKTVYDLAACEWKLTATTKVIQPATCETERRALSEGSALARQTELT